MKQDPRLPAPHTAAQILEEAGLAPSQTACVRSGRPLLVDDGARAFRVHPFLFALRPEHTAAEVTLNWENDEARWVPLEGIPALDAVPLLAETWERLALSPSQQAAVQRLADDRQHGAAQLAAWAVDALREEAAALAAVEGGSGGAMLETLQSFAFHLGCCRPSMAAVANSVAAVLATAQEGLAAGGSGSGDAVAARAADVCAHVMAAAAEQQRRLAGAATALSQHTRGLLRDGATLITTSLSFSVLNAVKEAAGKTGIALHPPCCLPTPPPPPRQSAATASSSLPSRRGRHAPAGVRVRGAAAVRGSGSGRGLGGGGRALHAHHGRTGGLAACACAA